MCKGRVLILEDEQQLGLMLQEVLESEDYEVVYVGDARTASRKLDVSKFDIVVSDFKMEGETGLQFFARMVLALPGHERPAFILISGYLPDGKALVRPLPQRIPFLSKPFTSDRIIAVVNSEMLQRRFRRRALGTI